MSTDPVRGYQTLPDFETCYLKRNAALSVPTINFSNANITDSYDALKQFIGVTSVTFTLAVGSGNVIVEKAFYDTSTTTPSDFHYKRIAANGAESTSSFHTNGATLIIPAAEIPANSSSEVIYKIRSYAATGTGAGASDALGNPSNQIELVLPPINTKKNILWLNWNYTNNTVAINFKRGVDHLGKVFVVIVEEIGGGGPVTHNVSAASTQLLQTFNPQKEYNITVYPQGNSDLAVSRYAVAIPDCPSVQPADIVSTLSADYKTLSIAVTAPNPVDGNFMDTGLTQQERWSRVDTAVVSKADYEHHKKELTDGKITLQDFQSRLNILASASPVKASKGVTIGGEFDPLAGQATGTINAGLYENGQWKLQKDTEYLVLSRAYAGATLQKSSYTPWVADLEPVIIPAAAGPEVPSIKTLASQRKYDEKAPALTFNVLPSEASFEGYAAIKIFDENILRSDENWGTMSAEEKEVIYATTPIGAAEVKLPESWDTYTGFDITVSGTSKGWGGMKYYAKTGLKYYIVARIVGVDKSNKGELKLVGPFMLVEDESSDQKIYSNIRVTPNGVFPTNGIWLDNLGPEYAGKILKVHLGNLVVHSVTLSGENKQLIFPQSKCEQYRPRTGRKIFVVSVEGNRLKDRYGKPPIICLVGEK